MRASIIHPHEIKPFRRRDRAAGGAVAGGERGCKIIRTPAALADPDQRAHHRAHLTVQERASRSDDPDRIALPRDVKLIERLLRRLRLALSITKRREIMLAEQPLRGLMHRLRIETPRHTPDAADVKREIRARVGDTI